MIPEGKQVTLHYTGKLTDGTVFDSSEGKEPLTFTIGSEQVIPGFEAGVRSCAVGEKKTFLVKKEDAYPYRDELAQTVPRSAVPQGIALHEGMTLALRAPTGQTLPARVSKLTESEVTLDLNMPIAGKDLEFTVEIVKIE